MDEASVKILGSNQVQNKLNCSARIRTTNTEL